MFRKGGTRRIVPEALNPRLDDLESRGKVCNYSDSRVVGVCEDTEESAGYLRGLVIQFPTLTIGHPIRHANVCMYV